jgi:redox-sensitive bicupin YhaK (pirin superfamily)
MVRREVLEVVTAHTQREGAGFVVRRPFPGPSLDYADPFLLLDEMGPVAYRPGEAMNTEREIRQAIEDHRAGRLGAIAR